MLGIKKKNVVFIIIITIVVFGLIMGSVYFFTNTSDEKIKKYSDAMSNILNEDTHYLLELQLTHRGEVPIRRDEYYQSERNLLKISTYPREEDLGESHIMIYEGKTYSYSTRGDVVDASISNDRLPLDRIPDSVVSSYYSINGANVTYEEKDGGYIFTYENKMRKYDTIIDKYKEEVTGKYTSAISVTYFDKEWNIEKMVITETWNAIDADGQEQERERIITISYYDSSSEEIKEAFKEEVEMIGEALK